MRASNKSPKKDPLKQLLDYCRGVQFEFVADQKLAAALLRRPYQGIRDNWELNEAMKQLLADELKRARLMVNIETDVTSDAQQHLKDLLLDMQNLEQEKQLKIWSLLWAYYICGISSKRICTTCNLARRRVQELLQEGRERNIAHKIAELEHGTLLPSASTKAVDRMAGDSVPSRLLRGPGSAPPVPAVFVGRDDDMQNMKERLGIRVGGKEAQLHVLTAVSGWPGVGKTTLAAALAYDADIQAEFPDGVLWASLGKTPSLLNELAAWGRALGISQLNAPSIEEAAAQLRAMLRDKRMLLIVDDVWKAEHVIPFRVGGNGCALLVTTRLNKVAHNIATGNIYVLGVLSKEHALELLREISPEVVSRKPKLSQELVKDLEGLPLAIQVAGRLLNIEIGYGFDIDDLLHEIREGAKLIEAQAPADRAEIANETTPTIAALLKRSTDLLKEEELEYYAYLGAFAPKPATFDADAMKDVWEVEDPKPTIRTLIDHGLLERLNDETGRYWMHAILVTHARSFLSD